MENLFRQGAFAGESPRHAYFVKCDNETTTQTDLNSGIVNIQVGFAPPEPAEFVVIQIQQLAGQIRSVQELQVPRKVGWAVRRGFRQSKRARGTTDVVAQREGGDPSTSLRLLGRSQHEAVGLERGLTHDQGVRGVGEQSPARKPSQRHQPRSVVIQSTLPLDVTAVFLVPGGIDVVPVAKRRILVGQ